ncbi:MAG: Glycosyl hydrolase family 57 [Parcubacteria group bacterium GW2011_GWC2_42_11]|nr:MAG: Glycosyl hydrolase family 57 [Parcubacteria group bacterium GW2011_GWC2_42_11]
MSAICFYFQVHQPRRIKRYQFFDIGTDHEYFNDAAELDTNNARVLRKVANKSYLPANAVLLENLRYHPEFKVAFSISGIALEQFEEYAPEVIESFQRLVDTGRVEILSETYYHSLSFLESPDEFREQVRMHAQKVKELFGVKPTVFRNTELIYRNDIAEMVADMGYLGMLAEGADHLLDWRKPTFVYHAKNDPTFKLLLKHYKLSDDIAFRFSNKGWEEWPLTAGKFAKWVDAHNGDGHVINLFMDYETFGEHQWEDTGIFNFLRAMPAEVLKHPDNSFVTPTEAFSTYGSVGEIDAPNYVSWADMERDLSAWMSNSIQHDALRAFFELESVVKKSGDPSVLRDWRRLSTSDHFYYMCTKWFQDGDVHAYFNPYESPYEAFIAYMNVLNDLRLRAHTGPDKKRSVWESVSYKARGVLQAIKS